AAGLNPRESAELNTLLRAIRADHDTSVLLIEHDMSVVMEISDHVVVLDYGTKISDGTPEEVRNDQRVIAAYGAGKSTLMMTIFGSPRASKGQVLYEGRDITRMPTHEIARLKIAQSP